MRYHLFLLIIILAACNQSEQPLKLAGQTMGTYYHISYFPADPQAQSGNVEELQTDIDSLLIRINQSLSTYILSSTISAVNGPDTLTEVDELFATVFVRAQEVAANTSGAFDVSVMPLVNAWGFGPADTILKNSETIDSLRDLVGYRKLRLKKTGCKQFLYKKDGRIKVDFSAIAKGFAVDLLCRYLDKKGIENYLVEIGGELRSRGKGVEGEAWKIGIDQPYDDPLGRNIELKAVLKLENRAIATSGNYRNYYYRDGKKVSHEIDPISGYPANNNLLSVAVTAADCITADAYATAFMVMGLEKSLAYLAQDTSLGAYLIFADDSGVMQTSFTENMENLLVERE